MLVFLCVFFKCLPLSTFLCNETGTVLPSQRDLFLHSFESGLVLGLLRQIEWGEGGLEQVLSQQEGTWQHLLSLKLLLGPQDADGTSGR